MLYFAFHILHSSFAAKGRAMPSYFLIEQQNLSPPRPRGKGIPANPIRMGLWDFLRELRQDEFSLTPYEGLIVEGIEDVLLASRPEMDAMAHRIRRELQRAASDLQDQLVASVQIVFRNKIVRGDEIWVEHPTAKLPIGKIFGSPHREASNGVPYYRIAFNLSSGL